MGKIAKETIRVRVIDVCITWVSNYKNWIPVIGHPRDRVPNTWQMARGEPITIENFAIDYQSNRRDIQANRSTDFHFEWLKQPC